MLLLENARDSKQRATKASFLTRSAQARRRPPARCSSTLTMTPYPHCYFKNVIVQNPILI